MLPREILAYIFLLDGKNYFYLAKTNTFLFVGNINKILQLQINSIKLRINSMKYDEMMYNYEIHQFESYNEKGIYFEVLGRKKQKSSKRSKKRNYKQF